MYRIAYVEIEDGPKFRCYCQPDLAIHKEDQCMIDINRTLEIAKVVELKDMQGDSGRERNIPRVLRVATLQDQAKASESALRSKMAFDTCSVKAEKYGLEMELVKVRFGFDRSILTVLFTAEERVDFREMVKELAVELRCRVEMKQIGVRDQAGLIGGLGPCGRCLCCCTWLDRFESINVKMAKDQRLSLNPAAISGMCGRLKCCLQYEEGCYRELNRSLPRDGADVLCPDGKGYVVDKNILAQRVRVRLEDGREFEYDVEDVKTTWIGRGSRVRSRETAL